MDTNISSLGSFDAVPSTVTPNVPYNVQADAIAEPQKQSHSLVLPAVLLVVSASLSFGVTKAAKSPVPSAPVHAAAEETSSLESQAFSESSISSDTSELAWFVSSSSATFFETEPVPVEPEVPVEPVIEPESPPEPEPFTIPQLPEPPVIPETHPSLPKSANAYGVYFTPTSVGRTDFFEETIADLQRSNGNAFIIDVKGSAVYFDADMPLAKELGLVKEQYDINEIVRFAHERGLYVMARFVAVKDAGLARAHPDSLIAHPATGRKIGYEFVDPEDPTVLQYNSEVICALAKTGIDEINLDYIRFSTAEVGELRTFSVEEKSRKVGVFVRMARDTINACGPHTKLGLSTFAILGWNYPVNLETLGQDFVSWAPMVDIISPMAYPSTFAVGAYYDPAKNKGSRMYYLVWRTLEGYKDLLGEHAAKIRPWIQGYGTTEKNMADQMQAVTDAGLCGFTVWSAQNVYENTFKAMAKWRPAGGC